MADKLVIRIEICQVIKHNQRVEDAHPRQQQHLRNARDHQSLPASLALKNFCIPGAK